MECRPLICKFKEYTTTGERIGLNFGFSEYSDYSTSRYSSLPVIILSA